MQNPLSPLRCRRRWMLAGLLVAFALRLFRLGAESLWYDETVSALLSNMTPAALVVHTAGDIHPPAYYLLLAGWRWLAHPTPAHGLEFLLAWPSLWFGLVSVALLAAIGRKLFSPLVGTLGLWLAAIHPFQLWYSQEVRMYTLAALCALLCLWAMLKTLGPGRSRRRWSLVWIGAATLGLYTLYYFAFWLVGLNLLALLGIARQSSNQPRGWVRPLVVWGAIQGTILLLWSPWLPIAWRQAVNPPVPGWRTPWASGLAVLQSVAEALAAWLVGQTPPGGFSGPWAVVTLALLVWAVMTGRRQRAASIAPSSAGDRFRFGGRVADLYGLLVLLLTPTALLFLISLTITPLYHVRYLFPFAAPFILIMAAGLAALSQRRRWLASMVALGYLLSAGWSLQQFWFDPFLRADDHRAAVNRLAQAWRPGDAILVNAGWVYPALAVYWPVERIGPFASLPPAPAAFIRLADVGATASQTTNDSPVEGPVIVRTGSVDGSSQLGWGDPRSDFFAISRGEAINALDRLAVQYDRLWHYRLYDTVSDPAASIREWLAIHGTLQEDQPFAGRDFLRLQRYDLARSGANSPATLVEPALVAEFAGGLQLVDLSIEQPVIAGQHLYVQTRWRRPPEQEAPLGDLAFSLRLYNDESVLLAQADASPVPPMTAWPPGQIIAAPLALPLPVATKPLTYTLALVLYARVTGQPVAAEFAGAETSILPLGVVNVKAPTKPPELGRPLARFDYIELVTVAMPSSITAGQVLPLDLVWRPRAVDDRDTFVARLSLRDRDGREVQQWQEALGGWLYPSGRWPPQLPVWDPLRLPVEAGRATGRYAVVLQVIRDSDQALIPAQLPWRWAKQEGYLLGMVEIAR
jgi:uncharacterized membrane protein